MPTPDPMPNHGRAVRRSRVFPLGSILALGVATITCGGSPAPSEPPAPPKLVRLLISPRSPVVAVHDSIRFSARVRRTDNQEVVLPVVWIASGGTFSPEGSYTPPDSSGEYRIIAAVMGQNLNDTVLVTVLPDTVTPLPPVGPDTGHTTPPDTTVAPPPPDTTGTPVDTVNSNEPPGMTALTERGFDSRYEAGWYVRESTAFSIVTDSTAPRSPANVAQALYAPRIPCGTGPMQTAYRWTAMAPRTLYISYWLKVDPVWYGSTSLVNKVFFIHIAGGGRVVVNVHGARTGRLAMEVRLQAMGVTTPRSASWNAPANINPAAATIPRGQWVHQEIVLVANTPGVADGVITFWQNAVKVGEYTTDVGFSDATETGSKNVWEKVDWNPIYGGGCNVPSVNGLPTLDQFPVPQWMRIDHIYVSGKN